MDVNSFFKGKFEEGSGCLLIPLRVVSDLVIWALYHNVQLGEGDPNNKPNG